MLSRICRLLPTRGAPAALGFARLTRHAAPGLLVPGLAAMLALAGLTVACGSGKRALDPDGNVRRSEFTVATAPEGLQEAVSADSIRWEVRAFGITEDGELIVDGDYGIVFRSRADQTVEMRYDLRFLDVDGFFVDRFIPFGLPVRLAPGQTKVEEGQFSIRSRELRGVEYLTTLRIVATLALPEPQ